MTQSRILGLNTLTRNQKITIGGVATAGIAALTVSLVPGSSSTGIEPVAASHSAAAPAWSTAKQWEQSSELSDHVAQQQVVAYQGAKSAAAEARKAEAAKQAEAAKKAEAEKQAANERKAEESASRSAEHSKPAYANNLDGWINEALDIMKDKGIPGSYEGLHRNIMRESSGNPNAINNWDINAINGVPSKGLLQVIQPTFDAYHVAGTKHDLYDPVANITAAANYAADRYGTIDNVDSAY
ncbi:transglycosylase SLT domain-containing protein [Streptomyces albidoflavus]|uniref:transglycosylase SLT domain-containing protein n=1 Tax=Streptomyces albidoflavus TaxID=1886 RepID=UPI00340AB674